MTKLTIYKIKFKGREKPDHLENYQMEGTIGVETGGYNSIVELVKDLYKKRDWETFRNFQIFFQKPFDIQECDDGFIVTKNLNLLERLILKRELRKRFTSEPTH